MLYVHSPVLLLWPIMDWGNIMRLIIIMLVFMLLTGCNAARVESGKSLLNAEEAVKELLTTELNECQQRLASSISVAMNPAIDFLDHNWYGGKDNLKPTVTAKDWKADPIAAEKNVIFQAAKAQAANESWFSSVDSWTAMFYSGVALLFGASGLATVKKVMNLRGALGDALKFGNEALDADTPEAKDAVKKRAIARKENASHANELDRARIKMERSES